MNIYKLSWPILIYNINSTSNKDGQISKVIDVVLWYQPYSDQTLFIVFSLNKQNFILSFTWLKKHNSKINQQKEEVKIVKYLQSGTFPNLVEDFENTENTSWTTTQYEKELEDYYMTSLLLELSALNLCMTVTSS